jgi:hypothetical protein
MGDHVVVLRSDDPLGFIADACAPTGGSSERNAPVTIQ